MRFTDRSIEALQARDERYIVWDDANTGLGLRVTPEATKTYIIAYRFDGMSRMHTIGNAMGVSLIDARIAYHAAMAKVWKAKIAREHGETPSQDLDPAAAKRTARKTQRAADTLADLWTAFTAARRPTWRPATGRENDRMWKAYLQDLSPKRARDISPRDVKALLDKVAVTGPVQSNRLRAMLAAIFYFAMEKFIVDESPVVRVRRVAKETARDRAMIDDAELRGFLAAMDAPGWPAAERRALLMALATGSRPGETVAMTWAQIDEQARTWTIPAEIAKTGLAHVVPLSDFAMAVLEECRAAGAMVTYPMADVPGDVQLERHELSEAMAARKALLAQHGVAPLRPHDLRRTCRSWLSKLRVPEQIAERCIGHVQKNVLVKTYDRYEYLDEKREAFDKWGETLTALRAGDNVWPLRSKAAA